MKKTEHVENEELVEAIVWVIQILVSIILIFYVISKFV